MSWGILIGYGSIGKRHLVEMHKYVENVLVIDLNLETKALLAKIPGQHEYLNSISELLNNNLYFSMEFEILVLANWAPDRRQILNDIRDVTFKRILIEKPVASSLADVDWINKFIGSRHIPSAVNFHLRFSAFPKLVEEIGREYSLGPISKIFESGGAKCFSANGIHWLDLAMYLYKEPPSNVFSTHNFEKINPRSSSLNVVDGYALWTFSSNRRFEISYSNLSSFPSRLQIYHRHALMTLTNDELVVEIQSDHLEDHLLAITRTTEPKVTFTKKDVFRSENGEDGISQLYKDLFEGRCNINDFCQSTRSLLSSFAFDKVMKEQVDIVRSFNPYLSIFKREYEMDWRVT